MTCEFHVLVPCRIWDHVTLCVVLVLELYSKQSVKVPEKREREKEKEREIIKGMKVSRCGVHYAHITTCYTATHQRSKERGCTGRSIRAWASLWGARGSTSICQRSLPLSNGSQCCQVGCFIENLGGLVLLDLWSKVKKEWWLRSHTALPQVLTCFASSLSLATFSGSVPFDLLLAALRVCSFSLSCFLLLTTRSIVSNTLSWLRVSEETVYLSLSWKTQE